MALTNAERQARYRERRKAGESRLRYRRPADRRSRPQQWNDAVQTLLELQEQYRQWRDVLPESLAGSGTAELLEQVCDLDLSVLEYLQVVVRVFVRDPGPGRRLAEAVVDLPGPAPPVRRRGRPRSGGVRLRAGGARPRRRPRAGVAGTACGWRRRGAAARPRRCASNAGSVRWPRRSSMR